MSIACEGPFVNSPEESADNSHPVLSPVGIVEGSAYEVAVYARTADFGTGRPGTVPAPPPAGRPADRETLEKIVRKEKRLWLSATVTSFRRWAEGSAPPSRGARSPGRRAESRLRLRCRPPLPRSRACLQTRAPGQRTLRYSPRRRIPGTAASRGGSPTEGNFWTIVLSVEACAVCAASASANI